MTITLQWWQWTMPAIVACAIIGLYMGWRIMGLWTVGVFFSGLVAARLGPKLGQLTTKLLSVGGQFFAIATGKDEATISTPKVTIASPWEPVAIAVFFAGLLWLSWIIARRLTNKDEIGLLGHLLGAAFGALASLIALSQGFDYWADFIRRSGANSNSGAAVTVPQVSIAIAGIPSTNPLVGLATGAIGLFLLLIIVYTIWRALRAT